MDDVVRGADVLDLFAGSGAMGLEALSRGANEVTFVDNDERSLRVIRKNLDTLKLGPASVIGGDVLRLATEWSAQGERWDLALIDPPYDHPDDAWLDLLDVLPSDLAVLESDREVEPPFGWEVLRSKRYGRTNVLIATRRPV